jgi:hypothetical protein
VVVFFLAEADLAPAALGDLAGLDGVDDEGGGEPEMLGWEFSDAWESRAREEHGDFDGVLAAARAAVGAKGLVGVFLAAAGAKGFVGIFLAAAGAKGLAGVLAAAVAIARISSTRRDRIRL